MRSGWRGLAAVAARVEGLAGVVDDAPAAGGCGGGEGGRALGRGRRSREQLGREGEGQAAGRVGDRSRRAAVERGSPRTSSAPVSMSGRKLVS